MAKKKGIVLKLPEQALKDVELKCLGYGLHLVATGKRPKSDMPVGNWKSVRIVLSRRAQIHWDSSLPEFPSMAALATTALVVLKEAGPSAQNVKHI